MKRSFVLLVVIFIGLLVISASVFISNKGTNTEGIQSLGGVGLKPDLDFGKFPLYFIVNKGQVNETVAFYAKASRYTLWLTKQGLVFDSFKRSKVKGEKSKERNGEISLHSPHSSYTTERDVSRLFFLNANKNPEIVPINEAKLRVNYFKGKDKSKWHCDIPTSRAVLYKNLYKEIDLKVYGIEKEIEYDWVVKPGGNPWDIRFKYKNVKGTRLDDEGNLLIETDFGVLMHKKPFSYQEIKTQRKMVTVGFRKTGKNTYGFEVGKYDKRYELIIDPVVLAYATYLGGSGDDTSGGIAVDSSGNAYITGETYSLDFPGFNQYQTNDADINAFVTKLDTTQTGAASLIYSTYLGGNESDFATGIAADNSGNVYVSGRTKSTDFPMMNQYQTNSASMDGFVTRLDTTQSGAASLIYSTYLGGNAFDSATGIAVDNSGNAYVTGVTNSGNFPTLNQYQTAQGSIGSDSDIFITKLDTSKEGVSSLIYSTYLGGTVIDHSTGIAVDINSSGNVYVTGYTYSYDFPTLNPYQAKPSAFTNAFVAKIDTTKAGGSCLIYSTYLGGSDIDYGSGIAVDASSSGIVYIIGTTSSSDFPTLNHYQTFQGYIDIFVSKIDTTQSGASSLLYSTYLGGDDSDLGKGIAVDVTISGIVYVTGYTSDSDFPTLNQYQTYQGSRDAFVSKLDTTKAGVSGLIYSTYLGGERSEYGNGIAVDSSGNVYVTGNTKSADFPTLNQYQAKQPGVDVFVAKLLAYTGPPYIQLNRSNLHFAAVFGDSQTGSQTFLITNEGEDTLNWTAAPSDNWIEINPSSGTGSGLVTVSVNTAGLAVGTYTGTISIADASNSPRNVSVTLNIYTTGTTGVPFGQFSTPVEGSIVRGSIPVTGWVLDDIGVQRVQLFREEVNALVYIGDAVFVEGARPDVEQAYPDYPYNFRAGWGYMMLTNFLPNGGNGTFKINAIATDIEGNQLTLGSKTIICDNADAVEPFGAIDTPKQGGTASGSGYVNFGWALTPQPNTIPTDDSSITVWVNGVPLGNPVYNQYREDIATVFPGYNNSDGAVGYFYLDTTKYKNGVHTIAWSVKDDAGNEDGIGSRYFTIQNTGGDQRCREQACLFRESIFRIPVDYSEPVEIKKGYNLNKDADILYPDEKGNIHIRMKELQRLQIHFSKPLLNLSNLPVGSFLDSKKGVFYWQAGPGFVGNYRLAFIIEDHLGNKTKKHVWVTIVPKFQKSIERK